MRSHDPTPEQILIPESTGGDTHLVVPHHPLDSTTSFYMAFHRRGVSIRHLAFAGAFSLALCTIYYIQLYGGVPGFVTEGELIFWPSETPQTWARRAAQVKEAFLHAYHGYEQYASPHDELRPISNSQSDRCVLSLRHGAVRHTIRQLQRLGGLCCRRTRHHAPHGPHRGV